MHNEQMLELAEQLYENYIKPRVQEALKGTLKVSRATVTRAPQNGVIGVSAPFDGEMLIPFVPSVGTATVGDSVWIAVPHDNTLTNAFVIATGMWQNL